MSDSTPSSPIRSQDRVQFRILLFAIAAGLLAAFLVWMYLRAAIFNISGGHLTEVVVATQDLKPGETLSPDKITIRKMPELYVHQKAVNGPDMKVLYGQRIITAINSGQPILFNDLFPETSQTLSAKLQSNQRAVSIALDGTRGMSGLISPGDRIDLLINQRGAPGSNRAKSLLQNITVLAVDGESSAYQDLYGIQNKSKSLADAVTGSSGSSGPSNAPKGSTTLTLLLSPKDAAMVILAQSVGTLQVLLRSPHDLIVDPSLSFSDADLNKLGIQGYSTGTLDSKLSNSYPQIIEGGVNKGTGFLPEMVPQLEQLQELQRRAAELQQNLPAKK